MYNTNVYIMVRTQVYLTEAERAGLRTLSSSSGKKQSELIREAVDLLLNENGERRRDGILNEAAGIWRNRRDLPDFDESRRSWDRG